MLQQEENYAFSLAGPYLQSQEELVHNPHFLNHKSGLLMVKNNYVVHQAAMNEGRKNQVSIGCRRAISGAKTCLSFT